MRRSKKGKIDNKKGTHMNVTPTVTKVKYYKEIRLVLGVAIVILPSGKTEERRFEPFDYTEQTIVADADYEKKILD